MPYIIDPAPVYDIGDIVYCRAAVESGDDENNIAGVVCGYVVSVSELMYQVAWCNSEGLSNHYDFELCESKFWVAGSEGKT